MPRLPPRWSAAFGFAVLVGIAVWGKGWERGAIIAGLLAMAIVFPLTEWWRLYVVTLLPVFAIVVLYLFATPKGDRS